MQVAVKSPNLTTNGESQKFQLKLISPVIKSSRGARFLDLVKNNKINVSPQLTKRISMKKNLADELMERNTKKDENEDYLKFSSPLPDVNSSPSSGILSKRKATVETPDSPSNNLAKRKRVSFNDPVSTTKEYLITEEEERHKSNNIIRCLVYNENNEEQNEDDEKECENKENLMIAPVSPEIKKETDPYVVVKMENDEIKNPIEMDHNYDKENPQNTDITTSSFEENIDQEDDVTPEEEEPSKNELTFKNKNELLDYITKNISIDEIFEKLTQVEEKILTRKEIVDKVLQTVDFKDMLNSMLPVADTKQTQLTTEQVETTVELINHISKLMKTNDRIKHKVLDTLSEKHSRDFLSHALQENSTSTVCEKITIPNIVNYLIHKVNTCEDDEIDFEVNKMNRAIMHHLIKKTSNTREIVSDQKETQELLNLLFKNRQKIEVLDTVHEFLRSHIIKNQF